MGDIVSMQPSNRRDITALCRSFPTLRGNVSGVDPWDPNKFDSWASGPVPGHGARYAAQFILAVWNGRGGHLGKPRKTPAGDSWHGIWRFNVDTPWRCGPFDLVDALSTWDDRHREAFIEWAQKPWWP